MVTAPPVSHLTGTITFLLTDVEGSTIYWESHPQEMAAALTRHDALIDEAAAAHNGQVVRPRGEGDSRFVVFSHAGDALAAVIAMQRGLAVELSDLPFPIKVRAGLHTGTADWRDGDYYGPVVNRCARIRSLGHGGQTLLSRATADLVRDSLSDEVTLVDLGTHRLRGLPQPERIYQVIVPDLPADFPPLKSAPAFVRNLPATTTPLIGRYREMTEVVELLAHHNVRFLTLTGPGGMGKTRLALAVGEALLDHFQDGVCFVNLAALSQPEAIVPAIAVALGYQAPDNTRPLLPQLLSMLAQRQLLLILDNFEHVVAGASLVDNILKACPQVAILATSRQPLKLVGETRYQLSGLDFPNWSAPENAPTSAAVQLFVTSGRRFLPDFDLTQDNLGDVMRICQLVQGVPLGLVLAATWLELLSPADIADEIQNSLDFLASDLADLPARQRSMEAVFEGSWQMLLPEEQVVLVRLSVFRDGFTRKAAETVAGAALRVLLGLVNKSLLQRQGDSDRFTLHELLRQFAAAKCREVDVIEEAALAHCRYFAALVQTEIRRALYFYPLHMPRQHAADRGNLLRAWDYALQHALGEELAALARGMVLLSLAQGTLPTAMPEQAIRVLGERGGPPDGPLLHLRLTTLAACDGIEDHYRLRDRFLTLLSLVEAHDDPELRYWMYERLALVFLDLRDPESVVWAAKARQATVEMGDALYVKGADVVYAWNRILVEPHDPAMGEQLEALLSFFDQPQFRDSFVFYAALAALGVYYRMAGEGARSVHFLKRALTVAEGWRDLLWISLMLGELAHTYQEMDRPHEVSRQELNALEWHVEIGQTWQTLGYLWSIPIERPQLIPDRAAAVAILSMVYHHPEATPYYRQKIEEALPALRTELGGASFAATWEDGRTLTFDAAVAQVRAALALMGTEKQ